MSDRTTNQPRQPATPEDLQATAFSNGIRLSGREWRIVGLFALTLVFFAPVAWKRAEKFDPDPDYRLPYKLSQDYWLFERYARLAAARHDTLLLGDSVIWGQYVTHGQTLSHRLNQLEGEEKFANLGLDGAHPAALSGLIEHYCRGVTGKNIVLHCNLLWMSSPRHDLQTREEFVFNHPRLVPQFVPDIPCYKEPISPRIGIVVEQHSGFSSWTNHLQQAYFAGSDVPSWTMSRPYVNPVRNVCAGLPSEDDGPRHEAIPWTQRGIQRQSFAWVDADTSLQWHFFRQTVNTLRARGNRVFVLVGPFNEHMLTAENHHAYAAVKQAVGDWLRREQIPYWVPPPLPSELYADASHPLDAGYALLARQLLPRLTRAH